MPKSTKEGIRNELAQLLRTKQLDEITVTELVEKCGISRQAFYYHFTDLYGVVDWALEQELKKLSGLRTEQWWKDLNQIVEVLYENRTVVLNIYRAYERSYVEYNLRRWLKPSISAQVEAAAQRHTVTEDQKDFVAELCTQGMINMLLNWVDRGMRSRFTDRLDDLYAILDGSLDYMLERLAQQRKVFDRGGKMSKD